MDELKGLTAEELEKEAKIDGLGDVERKVYVALFTIRFPGWQAESYRKEWMGRIRTKYGIPYGDKETVKVILDVLNEMNKKMGD